MYQKIVIPLALSLILVGCTNQETTQETDETEDIHKTEQEKISNEEQALQDNALQDKAEAIEKNLIKYIEKEDYKNTIASYKTSFVQNANKSLKPTEKTIEVYNLAVQMYFEEAETFDEYDYRRLSLDMKNLNENVTSLIQEKFPGEIESIEVAIEQAPEIRANERAALEKEENARRIEEAKNHVRIGMTKEQVLATFWGEPKDINRTITASHTSEQWVYPYRGYLYFEDGILVTIQD